MNIDHIYTSLEEAKKEIKKRSANNDLKKKIELFLDNKLPGFLHKRPVFCMTRHIHSPNYELFYFLDMIKDQGFDIKLLEYQKDKFTTNNLLKYYLAKMYFNIGVGKKGGKKVVSRAIIDIDKSNGKQLFMIHTLSGKKFVDFHHELLETVGDGIINEVFDISDWLESHGSESGSYYIKYLALFVSHGILFENFLMEGEEGKLTKKVVLPAIQEIEKKFGFKPLIVRLIPKDSENDISWSFYPKKVMDCLK